jgi:hypothetical protein
MAKAASGGGAGVGLRDMTLWLSQRPLHHHHAGCMWRNIPSIEYSAAIHIPAPFKTSCPNDIAYMVEILSGNGQIITIESRNLNTRFTPYLHASISPYLQVLSRQTGNVYFEASSAALMASQLAFASPNNILVLGA